MKAYEEAKVSLLSFLTIPLAAVNDQLHARVTLPPPVYTEQDGWTSGANLDAL